MTGTSHVFIGLAGYAALAFHTPLPFSMTTTTAAVVGSLAPDIDHPSSRVGRLLWPISYPLARIFGHRGLTHSALALLGLVVAVALVDEPVVTTLIAFAVGYALHLAADACTTQGVVLLYPARKRFRAPITVRTGGPGEWALTALILLLAAASVVLHPAGPDLPWP